MLYFFFPIEEVVEHLINASPNLEALHVGKKYQARGRTQSRRPSTANINFLGKIHFRNLTSLTLNGFDLMDGSYLSSVRFHSFQIEYFYDYF